MRTLRHIDHEAHDPRRRGIRGVRGLSVIAVACLATVLLAWPMGGAVQARDDNPIIMDGVPDRSGPRRSTGVVDGFFRSIFGGQRTRERRARPSQRHQTGPISGGTSAPVVLPAAPQPLPLEVDEKVLDAEVVLVLGGDYAEDVADGLDDAFAKTNNVRIERRIHRRSGLIGDEPVDWIDEVRDALDSGARIDAVVIAVGLNDRAVLSDSSGDHTPLSERWRGLYGERIDRLLLQLAPRRIPVVWVGLPPVADADKASDFLTMNTVYRLRSQSVGGTYVDVWQSFVDADGGYAASGPDIDGQDRVLREDDGIGFTRSGARKLGFFVERPLRRILRPDALDTPIASAPEAFDVEEVIAEERSTGIGRITALTNQAVPLGIDLIETAAGRSDGVVNDDDTHHALFVEGDVDLERIGRANDFRWPGGDRDVETEIDADPDTPPAGGEAASDGPLDGPAAGEATAPSAPVGPRAELR